MASDQVNLNQLPNRLIVAQLDAGYQWIERAADGLTDEQLYYQPTSDTNSIAWLVWHLSRWRDAKGATISGVPQVWISEGWAERFGMGADRTGLGDTVEQVASFKPDRDDLLGYAGAAHRAIVECVSRLAPERFEQPVEYMPGDLRTVWTFLFGVVGFWTLIVGVILFLRGMFRGLGWL